MAVYPECGSRPIPQHTMASGGTSEVELPAKQVAGIMNGPTSPVSSRTRSKDKQNVLTSSISPPLAKQKQSKVKHPESGTISKVSRARSVPASLTAEKGSALALHLSLASPSH